MKQGYYLTKNGQNHFISEDVNPRALHKVCDKVLTKNDWSYSIEYFYGYGFDGVARWANNSFKQEFLDAALQ